MKAILTALILGAAAIAVLSPTASRSEGAAGTGIDWKATGSSRTSLSSIQWCKSFKEARSKAARERKPILLLHLFGRLDEDLC